MTDTKKSNNTLKRSLGLTSLIAIGVGMVVGQGALVAVLQGVGINPSAFLVAMLIAFALTLSYIFTFTELSLMMPKAGGISTYTEVAIGHFPAIIVTIAGYLGPAIFAGAANINTVENRGAVPPGIYKPIFSIGTAFCQQLIPFIVSTAISSGI